MSSSWMPRRWILGPGACLLAGCGSAPAMDGEALRAPAATTSSGGGASAASPGVLSTPAEPDLFFANVPSKPPAASRAALPCPARVPDALNPPESVTLALALPADGVQVYVCGSAKPGDAPAWLLDGHHALLGSRSDVVGTHFAGPTWQTLDGSSVKGAKLTSADAPSPDAIPWLLLAGTASAEGQLARVTFIQRLGTVGGKAPAAGCDASHLGARALVPYQATYYFYRAPEPGEAVRQCRSKGTRAPAR